MKKKKNLTECHAEIAALKKELAYKTAILDNLPAIAYINEGWIIDGVYHMKNVWANQYAYDYTGLTREDCDKMGENFGQIVLHPDDFEIALNSLKYLYETENTEKAYGGPYRFKLKNGKYIWGIGFAKMLIPSNDNGHRQFVNCMIPLSEPLQADAQIQYLIAENRRKGKESIISKITPTEIKVLKLIALGWTICQIADKLYLSKRTVSTHKNNIMKKLGLHTLSALASFANQNGIV